MAKGDIAKQLVVTKLEKAFGNDWLGKADNGKYYLYANELGEQVQICLTISCPKNPITVVKTEGIAFENGGIDFEAMDEAKPVLISNEETYEPTQEEKDNIAKLMKSLGL